MECDPVTVDVHFEDCPDDCGGHSQAAMIETGAAAAGGDAPVDPAPAPPAKAAQLRFEL